MSRKSITWCVIVLLARILCGERTRGSDDAPVPDRVLAKCDQYLAELFRQPDESALLDELCSRIDSTVDTGDRAEIGKIPEFQKVLWDVWSAKALIDNGGMHYYLTGDFIDYAGRAESFRRLGLQSCCDALEKAYAVFPNKTVPDNLEERKRIFKELPEEILDYWDDVTDEFFNSDDQLVLRLGNYVRAHADSFATLAGHKSAKEYAALLEKRVPTPSRAAPPSDAIKWLEAIGGGSLDQSKERLTSVWLGRERRSTALELATLAQMDVAKDIEELSLDETSFTDRDAHLLLKFPRLKRLSIYGVEATSATADVLEQIPTLRELDLYGTRIPYQRFVKLLQKKEKELEEVRYRYRK